MQINCHYFSKQGVTLDDLIKYLKSRFLDIKIDLSEKRFSETDETNTISGRIQFMDGDQLSGIYVWIPGYKESNNILKYPVDTINGESILLSSVFEDNISLLFNDIAQKFGGYLYQNGDIDKDHSNYYWKYIKGSPEHQTQLDPIEDEIFNLYSKYYNKTKTQYSPQIKNSITLNYILDFIKENLDEIKKL